jgi:CheY-like chemotaxis protein
MEILIIEDDKFSISVLEHSIKKLGHRSHIAKTGEEAIEMFSCVNPDILFTDIMMPGISGLSLITLLRKVRQCKAPIVIMSTLNHKPLLDAAFEAGANDFLSKPVLIEELEKKLLKFDKRLNDDTAGGG